MQDYDCVHKKSNCFVFESAFILALGDVSKRKERYILRINSGLVGGSLTYMHLQTTKILILVHNFRE